MGYWIPKGKHRAYRVFKIAILDIGVLAIDLSALALIVTVLMGYIGHLNIIVVV
jgi:hypothetical protein